MEREFVNVGVNPIRVKGDFVQPGDTFRAYPEMIAFYLQIEAVKPTTDAPLEQTSPELLAEAMATALRQKHGIDCTSSVPLDFAKNGH